MTTNRNYIYAYDDHSHQIIVIDARTGERITQKENRVLSILSYLDEQKASTKLRKFALWCARKTNPQIKPIQKKFLDLAEQAIETGAEQPQLQQLYSKSEGEAIATDTVGLQQGSTQAAEFLATRECINPNPFEAAKNTARFHCLWAEMNQAEHQLPDFMDEIDLAASKDIIEQTEQQQVDYLLDLIGENDAKS